MPSLRPEGHIVALLVADLHLSHKPPVARSAEPDWYAAMERQLRELQNLSTSLNGPLSPPVPIICAGDIFDSAKQPVELVNFAIQHLPQMYAVPGNHELPCHRYDDLHKSPYWTLVKAGRVIDLTPWKDHCIGNLIMHGYPYGFEPKPLEHWEADIPLQVAVVHQYVWTKESGYPGAPESHRLKEFRKKVKGYDVAVVGDNHKSFTSHSDKETTVMNVGGFFRRKIDEIDHKPSVGLLMVNGRVKRHYLDVSKDKFLTAERLTTMMEGIGFETFVESLQGLADNALDFSERLMQWLERKKVNQETKETILRWLGREK